MDVVVIGMGEVGKHIAEVLVSERKNVTLVDRSESALAQAQETMDAMTLCGDAGRIETLTQAGVPDSDLFIAVTDDDESNLLACLMARKLGAKRVVARVSDTTNPVVVDSSWAASLGIDRVISPELAAAVEIRRIIETAGVSWVESYGEERIEMMRLRAQEGTSPAIGQALANITTPRNTLVAAIGRAGHFIIPDGSERIAADDDLYLIGRTEALPEARDVLVGPHRPASKVVIIGASSVGRAIAKQLESTEITACIVERDASKAEAVAMELSHAEIYHGDGTQSDFLRQEGLHTADVFVAVTKSDELNLMAGLLAKKMGVPNVIAIAHKPDYAPIYEELGIDTTISPRFLAAQAVLRYASKGWLISVGTIANGLGQVLEFHTAAGTPITAGRLRDVNFPQGARIGAVATESEVTVPGGDYIVPPDARVIVFTTPDRRTEVERLFRKRGLSIL